MDASLHLNGGSLDLAGPLIDSLARNAVESSPELLAKVKRVDEYHITVLSKAEHRRLRTSLSDDLPTIDVSRIYAVGIGGQSHEVYFVVIIWAAGQNFRRKLGLSPKDFHITLTQYNDLDVPKGIHTLLPGQYPANPSPDFLDHLIYTLHLFADYRSEELYCIQLISAAPNSHRGFLRLADASLCLETYKLAMLAYACAFQRTEEERVRTYCLRKMADCGCHTEWENVFLEHEKDQLPVVLLPKLLERWSLDLRQALAAMNTVTNLTISPRESLSLGFPSRDHLVYHRLPRFFRWLIPFHFALMSTPRNENDISLLAQMGIKRVLTLTEEGPLPDSWFAGKSISNTFLPIPNYQPPSVEQMTLILRLFEDPRNVPLLVHCGGGKGRAGTVAACYLAAYGFGLPKPHQEHPEMSAIEAIAALRLVRPGSLETIQQEEFVSRWCSTIWRQQAVLPEMPCEPPPWPLEVEGQLDAESDLFVLVGLPGSGKSWLSQALMKRDPKGWTYISQDEIGSRSSCESAIGKRPLTKRVILDRCNPSSADRRLWLQLAGTWSNAPVAVCFDYERDLCVSRAQQRAAHPTLPPGNRVRNAVAQMSEQFQRPMIEEGFKGVVIIRSFEACVELVQRLSPSVGTLKFPRTPHLIDVGGATSDDLVLDTNLIPGHVVITEKVDGANMGFSLCADRTKVLVQNRSHYVNPLTHAQFKKMGQWMERHHEDLMRVLDRDEHFPERYVLYGEWVYAKHSIPYTRLPDMFIAFDLYDRVTSTFADRQRLSSALADTSIASVPVMYEGEMPSESALLDMIQKRSAFWDGRVEGVYVKVEGHGRVVSRAKVVRGDFIAGDDHWTKGKLQVNGLIV